MLCPTPRPGTAVRQMVIYAVVALAAALPLAAVDVDAESLQPVGIPAWPQGVAAQTTLLMSLVAAVLGLGGAYTKPDRSILFVGVGFFGATLINLADLDILGRPWSNPAGFTFLAGCLCLRLIARDPGGTDRMLTAVGAVLLILATSLTILVESIVPANAWAVAAFNGPEIASTILYTAALAGFFFKGDWRTNKFEHWIILSLIVGLAAQIVGLRANNEETGNGSLVFQTLIFVSYGCILTGLILRNQDVIGQARARLTQLQDAQERLLDRMKNRRHALDAQASLRLTRSSGLRPYVNDNFSVSPPVQGRE